MAVKFGTLDLSIVTDHLIQMLRDCVAATEIWTLEPPAEGTPENTNPSQPVNVTVTGNAPDIVHGADDGCTLSLYLFHTSPDPYQRNSPVLGDRTKVPPLPFQPLSLDLYYLLSAYSPGRYIEEQQAMSIGMKCFYEQAIVKNVVLANDGRPKGEFVLSMEPTVSDEIGRLWQSFNVPNRFSVIYKISVVFVQPTADTRPIAKNPDVVSLSLGPTSSLFPAMAQLLSTTQHVRFIGPEDVPADPTKRDFHDYDMVPAVVAPGESFLLYGNGLTGAIKLFLVRPGVADLDVSTWIDGTATNNTQTRLKINVPKAPGVDAGSYQLKATVDAAPTNTTPFSLAAKVTPAADPPVVSYAGVALSFNGFGFVAGQTEVFLETVPLVENAAAGPGQFAIKLAGKQIQFQPPADLGTGRYGFRVRVNGIESTPAMWVDIP